MKILTDSALNNCVASSVACWLLTPSSNKNPPRTYLNKIIILNNRMREFLKQAIMKNELTKLP